MNGEYNYQPTELDDEIFLSEIPTSILLSSIDNQFNNPFEFRKKDYIQSFITKYEYCKDNMLDEDFALVEEDRETFFRHVISILYDNLNIGFPNINDISEEDQNELIHLTYRFFIKNIKKNFVSVIHNYIIENKSEITNKYEKKKDVTSLSFKSEIDDSYDTLVLGYLGNIIEDILEELKTNGDVDEFLDLCDYNEPSLELDFVKDSYNDFSITGNFVSKYIDYIDSDSFVEIQSKIRNRILKKYSDRKQKNSIEDTDQIDD